MSSSPGRVLIGPSVLGRPRGPEVGKSDGTCAEYPVRTSVVGPEARLLCLPQRRLRVQCGVWVSVFFHPLRPRVPYTDYTQQTSPKIG